MDLRSLPESIDSHERCAIRRMTIQDTLGVNLSLLGTEPNRIGQAEEKNCEQMFGSIPIPVGYAGPLKVTFSSQETADIHLPLATTEAALVASVNRGCKALSQAVGVRLTSIHHGISRTIAFRITNHESLLEPEPRSRGRITNFLKENESDWKRIGEATSSHLKIIGYEIDTSGDYVFLTISADTDEAMGMNMITIAAQAIGDAICRDVPSARLITIAGNVDSDKKPSRRTHDKGRGYEVSAICNLQSAIIESVLKTTPEKLLAVADAKLHHGSKLAGAIGSNLHAANIIAALYLATGQDAAHVAEGSLVDTTVEPITNHKSQITALKITSRCPAILVGVRGGGTELPAQKQCLDLLLHPQSTLRPAQQLAESIGAAVLAGEVSLLAAQAEQQLASSHKKLAR